MEVEKFPARNPFESLEPGNIVVVKECFRIIASKGTDHRYTVGRSTRYVKRSEAHTLPVEVIV